jgi:hypothetical protein
MLKSALVLGSSVLLLAACGGSENPDDGNGGGAAGSAGSAAEGGAGSGGTPAGGSGGVSPGGAAGADSGGDAGAGSAPVDAPLLARRLASSDDLNCVITDEAALHCWGFGSGLGATATYTQVSAQSGRTCAIEEDGSIDCFVSSPFQDNIPPGSFVEVRVGTHAACAKDDGGLLTCWDDGQAPAVIADAPSDPVSFFTFGFDSACAVLESGGVTCWGDDTGYPARLQPPHDDYVAMDGESALFGIRTDSTVEGWGWEFAEPQVPSGDGYVQLAAGAEHVCGLHADGTVTCAGLEATAAPEGERFVELSAGDGQTCGIAVDGRVLCWGVDGSENESPPDTIRAF